MDRIRKIISATVIALVALEGSVVHLAHSDHCYHRHGETYHRHGEAGHRHGEAGHRHGPTAQQSGQPTAGDSRAERLASTNSAEWSSNDTCIACSYLNGRTGAPRQHGVEVSTSGTGPVRLVRPSLAVTPQRSTQRTRAPPLSV